MACWIVKLKFTSPLHLGKSGIGMENVEKFVRSDTLFSALCYAYSAVFGNAAVSALIDAFREGNPPFIISSAFPYNKGMYFLPKPLIKAPVLRDSGEDFSYLKELNKLEFLPLDVFLNWVKGKAIKPDYISKIKGLYAGSLIYHLVPRVQLDRVTCASGLFHSGMIVFGPDAGLYCLIKAYDENFVDSLRAVFNWLGQSGLGGMRSLGKGSFEVEWILADGLWLDLLKGGSNANAYSVLSLFHPSDNEKSYPLTSAYYEIIERRGWSSSPLAEGQVRRKSCRMFAEGTVLTYQPTGQLIDVTPENWDAGLHPFYRYGYAFSVPVEVTN